MSKKELIDAIQGATAPCASITKKQVEAVLEAIGDVTAARLRSDEEINLPGLGKLTVKKRAPRVGRNPRTGEAVQVPAGKGIKFTVSSTLKNAVLG